jgi:phosphopantetheinyl transferase (holo-ACP synthase)
MLKVLRVRDEGIAWPSIELVRTEWGGVDVALSGTAAERAAARGLSSFAVSLTHEDGYAAAVVVAAESVAPE